MSTHGSTFFLAGTGTNGLTPSALFVKPRWGTCRWLAGPAAIPACRRAKSTGHGRATWTRGLDQRGSLLEIPLICGPSSARNMAVPRRAIGVRPPKRTPRNSGLWWRRY